MAQVLIRSLAGGLVAGLLLLAAAARGENEIFPNVHNEPITIRVLSGKDGEAQSHARVTLTAGFDKRDLQLGMWHEEAFTDGDGKVKLSSAMANLPFLQIKVAKKHLCPGESHAAIFSVDQIRRDGLSLPNGCGMVVVVVAPGVFTVFVTSKVSVPGAVLPLDPPVPVAKSAAPEQKQCRMHWFSCCTCGNAPLPPASSLR